ncbi:MAG TPA: alpha/beta hydrolase domain-containing protein [Acidimicrobiales bacterium]|nr:alpha/beta hydrolase domain-containing protein [Acidimicrobiales bacterium]
MAIVSGPVNGGSHGWAFGESPLGVDTFGYRQEEFFIEGDAVSYRLSSGTELTFDGHWDAEPAGSDAFKTRLIVLRPDDPSRFNGTVLLTWNNVSGGFDAWGGGAAEGAFAEGFAYVGVTAQRVGVHGFGDDPQGLVAWDPERYGTLSIPSDDLSYDVFTQTALSVGSGRTGPVDPMGGLDVRKIIASGGSQSAARLATYINAVQPLTNAMDAFLLTVYFGFGTPLDIGDAVLIPGTPDGARAFRREPHLIRDDLGIPLMVVNSESETPYCSTVRQPDTELSRWWEVAGSVHGSPDTLRDLFGRLGRDFGIELPASARAFHSSTHPVTDAALHHLQTWINGGSAPPQQPPIEVRGDPPQIIRDRDGIGRGGVRLPQADVPLAGTSPTAEALDFSTIDFGPQYAPFPAEEVRRRYGDRATYLDRFEEAARRAVKSGVLLPGAVDKLLAEAAAAFPAPD